LKLLVQPDDGIKQLVAGIENAKDCIDIFIFRCDRSEIERALADAVGRGVHVHALITYTNRGGEKSLRKLEMRLLGSGVTVARTANDLARYHGKMMIVDHSELYVLAFNLTRMDTDHSRSFGVITADRKLVKEATKLFEADSKRKPYTPGDARFLVSPENARDQLASFIKGAKKELLIYDPHISDPAMIRLLDERSKAGVDIRIMGRLDAKISKLTARRQPQMRLHTRTIVRDRSQAFVGSQSLRALELDARREVGVVFSEPEPVARLTSVFEADWGLTEEFGEMEVSEGPGSAAKLAKKVAKVVTRDMLPLKPILEDAVKSVVGENNHVQLNTEAIEETIKDVVKEAVKEAVRNAVEEGTGK
jgi:phosphatidylserine/phosphatidylglycerophosphate/cardiolipin synthase-like enzyme